jgi:hypothetical protein
MAYVLADGWLGSICRTGVAMTWEMLSADRPQSGALVRSLGADCGQRGSAILRLNSAV